MRAQAKRSSAVNHDGFAATRHALTALSVIALLMALLASTARAAYNTGTPLTATATVNGVTVNQASRDVYATSFGVSFSVAGRLMRFSSAGADLGCSTPVNTTDGAAAVAVNPVNSNVYLANYTSFPQTMNINTVDATCTTQVGASFPITPRALAIHPQAATDADGNFYLPNADNDTVKVFRPSGEEVVLTSPLVGLRNPSAVSLDLAENIYVAETGVPAVNERQTVTLTGLVTDASEFTLGNLPGDCASATTANIQYSDTPATRAARILAALEAQCGAGNFAVTTTANPVITFRDKYAGLDVPLMACAVTVGAGACSTATTTPPAPALPARITKYDDDGTLLGNFTTSGGSSIAVNKSTGDVFVGVGRGSTFHIEKYNSTGTKLDDFGAGLFGDITGTNIYNQLAVDETSGTVYATDAGRSEVEVFLPLRRLSVLKSGSGTGRVTSNVGGIDCGATCSADFADGDKPRLTATADSGSVFTGWSSGGCSGTNPCTVNIAGSDVEVTANFTAARRLTVTAVGSGRVSGSSGTIANCTSAGGANCSGSYQEAASVTLTATPDAHNRFSGWSGADVGSCDQTGATLTCPVTIPSHDAAITATFAPITRTLTVTPVGSGRVDASSGAIANCNSGGGTCAGTYNQNSVITLTATPNANQKFSGWSGADVGSCDRTGATLTCPVTIPAANAAITATFVLNDTDGDGVPDGSDACPAQAASTANGCPAPVVDPPPATCATNPSLCPLAVNKLGPCVKQANAAYKKALKAAKKKRGKARARAIKAAKKKKTRSVSRCKASFSSPSGR